jgi:hypothetical protein
MHPRSSSLLDVFSLVVVSAAPGHARRQRWPVDRSDLMRMQLRAGTTPCAELVAEGRAELQLLLPPRGQKAPHAAYRVTRLDGRLLHTRLLLPRRRSMPEFHLRVRHADGEIERLPLVEADGLVTEASLALRLRPGTTVIEIARCGRIELHWGE